MQNLGKPQLSVLYKIRVHSTGNANKLNCSTNSFLLTHHLSSLQREYRYQNYQQNQSVIYSYDATMLVSPVRTCPPRQLQSVGISHLVKMFQRVLTVVLQEKHQKRKHVFAFIQYSVTIFPPFVSFERYCDSWQKRFTGQCNLQ